VAPSRIFLGEFGVMKSEGLRQAARAADRLQWFADVRAEAEARGFFWAAWVYRGTGGFGLTEDVRDVNIEPGIIAALGLKPRTRHSAAPIK
jgi:endoglucanase